MLPKLTAIEAKEGNKFKISGTLVLRQFTQQNTVQSKEKWNNVTQTLSSSYPRMTFSHYNGTD